MTSPRFAHDRKTTIAVLATIIALASIGAATYLAAHGLLVESAGTVLAGRNFYQVLARMAA